MPSIVRDVAAMLVATTHFLIPGGGGWKICFCWSETTFKQINIFLYKGLLLLSIKKDFSAIYDSGIKKNVLVMHNSSLNLKKDHQQFTPHTFTFRSTQVGFNFVRIILMLVYLKKKPCNFKGFCGTSSHFSQRCSQRWWETPATDC